MNAEMSRLVYLKAETTYGRSARPFTSQYLAQVCSALVNAVEHFERMERMEDTGVRLYAEGQTVLEITREHISFEKQVRRGYDRAKEDFLVVFEAAKSCLQVEETMGLRCEMSAIVPNFSDSDAAHLLEAGISFLNEAQWKLLGLSDSSHAVGLRLYGERRGTSQYNIVIEPFLQDPRKFYVSVACVEDRPFPSTADLLTQMDEVYESITDRIPRFLDSLVHRSTVNALA